MSTPKDDARARAKRDAHARACAKRAEAKKRDAHRAELRAVQKLRAEALAIATATRRAQALLALTPFVFLGRGAFPQTSDDADFAAWVAFVEDNLPRLAGRAVRVAARGEKMGLDDAILTGDENPEARAALAFHVESLWERFTHGERGELGAPSHVAPNLPRPPRPPRPRRPGKDAP